MERNAAGDAASAHQQLDDTDSSAKITQLSEPADEYAPLLPKDQVGLEPPLYQTISRRKSIVGTSESSQLPAGDEDLELARIGRPQVTVGTWTAISVLLVGVFVANADSSLILSTYGLISSEFDDLDSGSWLLSSFVLAQCVAQPLYGKLSDIYGRKHCLQAAYTLFAIGTAWTGLGRSMVEIIAARAVQGAGSAGMSSMVSIIITDLVPLHEVATLRSYVNVMSTTGRSCGGVIGGALTMALGWRWAFLIQVPPTVLTIVLVQWRLNVPQKHRTNHTRWEKLKRIDFVGALFLCAFIFSACFILDTGGQKFPWDGTVILSMGIVLVITLIAFVVSAKFVAEPIFPLQLWTHYAVLTNYPICLLQIMNQGSLTMTVPLYFQVTNKSSSAAAGAHLIPAFLGNMAGGLSAGYWIKRTGLYKVTTVLAPFCALLAMSLCYFTWQGHTTILESLAIFPGGFAAGMVSSSCFVGLAAGVAEQDVAIASSGLYLFFNLGAIAGISTGSAVYQTSLRTGLERALEGVKDGGKVMERALSSITYTQNASDEVRALIVPAFVYSFHQVNLMSIVCAALSLLFAVFTQQKQLRR